MKKIPLFLFFFFVSAVLLYPVPKEIEDALKLNHINHFDEALEVIERALQEETIKPDITSTYAIGRILFRKGELYREMGELAILTNLGYFLQVKGREKNLPEEFMLFLGISHFFNRQYLEAAGILNQVTGSLKLDGDLAGLGRVYLGASYYRTGEKAKASDIWKNVKNVHPLAYSALGYVYAYLGINPSQGEEITREALRAGAGSPKYAGSLKMNHAYTLMTLGRFDEAYAEARGVSLDSPAHVLLQGKEKEVRFYDVPSILNYSSILFGEAIKNLEPIVSASSGELASFAAYYVAQMYLYLGSYDKSMKYAQKAKKLSVASSLTMVRATGCEAAVEILSGRGKKGLKILQDEVDRIHGKPSMLLELIQVLISSGAEFGYVKPFVSTAESFVNKTDWERSRRDTALMGELAFFTGNHAKAVEFLEDARDKGNKNKIETNDPNFLLKLSYVYYTRELFPESLEILFSLGRRFTGIRQLQDAVQSVYSYKQKGSGEAFID
jgi:tetratricopeptide (TPR) repeat protein